MSAVQLLIGLGKHSAVNSDWQALSQVFVTSTVIVTPRLCRSVIDGAMSGTIYSQNILPVPEQAGVVKKPSPVAHAPVASHSITAKRSNGSPFEVEKTCWHEPVWIVLWALASVGILQGASAGVKSAGHSVVAVQDLAGLESPIHSPNVPSSVPALASLPVSATIMTAAKIPLLIIIIVSNKTALDAGSNRRWSGREWNLLVGERGVFANCCSDSHPADGRQPAGSQRQRMDAADHASRATTEHVGSSRELLYVLS
jgi:hypothetical protein